MAIKVKINLDNKTFALNGSSLNLEGSLFDAHFSEIGNGQNILSLMYSKGGINEEDSPRIWNLLFNTGNSSKIQMYNANYEEHGSEIQIYGDVQAEISGESIKDILNR